MNTITPRDDKQLHTTASHNLAGVEDLEAAQGLLEFAKRFELVASKTADKLRLIEIDTSDEEGLAASLPGYRLTLLQDCHAQSMHFDACPASCKTRFIHYMANYTFLLSGLVQLASYLLMLDCH